MRTEFINYLGIIETTDPIIARIEEIGTFYKEVCPEEILDMFVSEFIKDDGNREYESLWLFSDSFVMEAKNFLIQDDFDIAPIKKSIQYCAIKKKKFDFNNATGESRMLFKWRSKEVGGELKASKANCMYLKMIISKYFLPNFVSKPVS